MKSSDDLGISWDSIYMYGGAAFLLASIDLDAFKIEVEQWRGEPIEGDREAETDWECFTAAVMAAKARAWYFAIADTNIGYIQWVGLADSPAEAIKQFMESTGCTDEGLTVKKLTAEQYIRLVDAPGDDPDALEYLACR